VRGLLTIRWVSLRSGGYHLLESRERIRLTGVPGFSGSLSSEQMWQLSIVKCQQITGHRPERLQEPLVQ